MERHVGDLSASTSQLKAARTAGQSLLALLFSDVMATSFAKKVFAGNHASEEKYSEIADYPSHKSPWLWQSPNN
jgi:hypothetical protein